MNLEKACDCCDTDHTTSTTTRIVIYLGSQGSGDGAGELKYGHKLRGVRKDLEERHDEEHG